MKEQTDYYESYQQYLYLVSNVESIKYKKGYVTAHKLNTAKLDIAKNDNNLLRSINQYNNAKYFITNETNISENATLQLRMDMKEKSYDENLTINRFKANNTTYMNAFKVKDEAKKELNQMTEKCRIAQKKYDNKKATLLDINQANVEKESAEIVYYKSCYEVIVWENILENCIYGGTV